MPTARAIAYQAAVQARWPLLVWWGTTCCKTFNGPCGGPFAPGEGFSQHSWGNAVDFHPPSKAYGDKVYAYLQANAGRFAIAHLLWQVPNHYDHIHADFNPQGQGTPPCAGGGPARFAGSGSDVAVAAIKKAPGKKCPPGYEPGQNTLSGLCVPKAGTIGVGPLKNLTDGIIHAPGAIVDAALGGMDEAVANFITKTLPNYLLIGSGALLMLFALFLIARELGAGVPDPVQVASRVGGGGASTAVRGARAARSRVAYRRTASRQSAGTGSADEATEAAAAMSKTARKRAGMSETASIRAA